MKESKRKGQIRKKMLGENDKLINTLIERSMIKLYMIKKGKERIR